MRALPSAWRGRGGAGDGARARAGARLRGALALAVEIGRLLFIPAVLVGAGMAASAIVMAVH